MQRIARLGDRYTMEVSLRTLKADQAAGVVAMLVQGITDKIRAYVNQGFSVGAPGSPTIVSGSGRALTVSGLTSGYQVKAGQFFSFSINGVSYLHQVTAAATGGGNTTLAIFPSLRVLPSSGTPANFLNPIIEGFIAEPNQSWTVGLGPWTDISFSIVEAS